MANITAKNFKDKIQKYMKVNFGVDLSAGSKRQVYEAVLGATNEILAENRYIFNKKVVIHTTNHTFYLFLQN